MIITVREAKQILEELRDDDKVEMSIFRGFSGFKNDSETQSDRFGSEGPSGGHGEPSGNKYPRGQ